MIELKGKVAVISGASRGIGRALAIGLSREECNTILIARDLPALEETAHRASGQNVRSIPCKVDISKPDDIHNLVELVNSEFDSLDILWNGAFGSLDGPIEECSEEDLSYFIDSSVKGNLLITKALLPSLLKSITPHIINVSADWDFPENAGMTAFIAAKRAMAGMGLALAREKKGKLRITNLHPADVASLDFDIDDDINEVVKNTENTMIPLRELIDIVIFILKLEHSVVHQIDIKPLLQNVGVTYL